MHPHMKTDSGLFGWCHPSPKSCAPFRPGEAGAVPIDPPEPGDRPHTNSHPKGDTGEKEKNQQQGRAFGQSSGRSTGKWLEGHDVMVRFQRIVDWNRVESMINLFVGNSGMHLVDRHMELEEHLVKAW